MHRSGDLDPLSLLTQPAVYVVLAFWAIGMIAYSRALALTSVSELTAVLLVTEIVVPGLAGIALLGDTVRTGWWWVLAAGLGLAVTGVLVLAGSPAQRPPPRRIGHWQIGHWQTGHRRFGHRHGTRPRFLPRRPTAD